MDEKFGPAPGHDMHAAPQTTPTGAVAAAPAVLPFLLDRVFGRDDITGVRHQVADGLKAAGLAGERLQGFVLAVNEVITNVVLHAGGHGRIGLWLAGGSAWCSVTDSGPGVPEKYQSAPDMPETSEVGGRGIWLAYQLCDEVSMATGPIGTTIGMRITLPRRGEASGLVNGASASG